MIRRVATVNIRHALPIDKFASDLSTVLAEHPDVLGAQECSGLARRGVLETAPRGQGYGLVNLRPYQTPLMFRADRYRLVDSFAWKLNGRLKHDDPRGAGTASKKSAIVAIVEDIDTGAVSAFAVCHLVPSIFLPVRKALHRRQIKRLAALVTHLLTITDDATVMGDFNCPPDERLQPLRDAGLIYGGSTLPTHDVRSIDHILSTVPMTGERTLTNLHTDHNAVLDTFEQEGDPVAKGFAPFAIAKPIPPGANDPGIKPVGGVCHVAVSESPSLYDFFNGPSGGIESHFYVRRDGTVEQYRSIYFEADANLDGNSFMRGNVRCGLLSIETQGMGAGEWTPEQVAAIKRIMSWAHREAGVTLDVIEAWNGDGWGYHTMWGAPSHWTPVSKTCPGPDRIKQFHRVLGPWLKAGGHDPEPKPNRVEQARALIEEALALLEATPEQRRRVHDALPDLEAFLVDLPEK